MEPIKLGENETVCKQVPWGWSYEANIPVKIWEKQVLTLDEVAGILNCSPATVSKLVKEHGLPCKKVGSLRLFSFYQIIKWVEDNN